MDWLRENGISELANPGKPTFALGSSIDKCLCLPGFFIPSTFLPSGTPDLPHLEISEDPPFFPASGIDYRYFSDHSTILLQIPCDQEEVPGRRTRCMRAEGPTDEERMERNTSLSELLEDSVPLAALRLPVVNINKLYSCNMKASKRTLFQERRPSSIPIGKDPFEQLLFINMQHPLMSGLLAALEKQDEDRGEGYICTIQRGGWMAYLKKVRKNDMRAFFAY